MEPSLGASAALPLESHKSKRTPLNSDTVLYWAPNWEVALSFLQ